MENQITLITVTKQDLFDIAHLLSAAVKAVFPKRKPQHLLVALQGSYESGKSIFADTLRDDIWGPRAECRITGKNSHDEYWLRQAKSSVMQYNYIDIANGSNYSDGNLNALKYDERERFFLQKQQHRGVTVIQNKRDGAGADIAIWVEKPQGEVVYYDRWGDAERDIMNDKDIRRAPKSSCAFAFKSAAALNHEWARYVEIRLDPKLVERSPLVQELLTVLAGQSARIKKNLELLRKGDCDVEEFKFRLRGPKYV